MAYDLVIFDCDGTLVDSEFLNNKATTDYLRSLGLAQYDMDYAFANFMGKTLEDIMRMVTAQTGTPIPPDFSDRIADRIDAGMDEFLVPIDGVRDIVAACAARGKVAVASNGTRRNVLASIRAAGLAKYFPDHVVFTKENVTRGKPAPDLYLLVAREMGVAPARCLVIEDSLPGVAAGHAAGMKVIGFTGSHHGDRNIWNRKLRDAGADEVVSGLAAIAGHI